MISCGVGIGFILLLSQSDSGIGGVYTLPFNGAVFLGWPMLVVINCVVVVLAVGVSTKLCTASSVILCKPLCQM
jgi:hypothetical protein